MFIKIDDIIVNTGYITSIALKKENETEDPYENGIIINLINKNRIIIDNISMSQIEYLLGKVDEKENKETRFEIMDL